MADETRAIISRGDNMYSADNPSVLSQLIRGMGGKARDAPIHSLRESAMPKMNEITVMMRK